MVWAKVRAVFKTEAKIRVDIGIMFRVLLEVQG